jgi:hypothetical protein
MLHAVPIAKLYLYPTHIMKSDLSESAEQIYNYAVYNFCLS